MRWRPTLVLLYHGGNIRGPIACPPFERILFPRMDFRHGFGIQRMRKTPHGAGNIQVAVTVNVVTLIQMVGITNRSGIGRDDGEVE